MVFNIVIGLFTSYAMIFLGTIMNKLVQKYNDGKMPLFCKKLAARKYIRNYGNSKGYCALKKSSRFKCLADIYPVGKYIASLGDFFIFLGIGIIIVSIIIICLVMINITFGL